MGFHQALAFTVLRLLSIMAALNLPQQFGGLMRGFFSAPLEETLFSIPMIYFLIYLISFLILWFAAEWLSQKIAPKTVDNNTQTTFNPEVIMSYGISLMGLFLIVTALPSVGIWVMMQLESVAPQDSFLLIGGGTRLLIGCILIIKSAGITKILKRVREF